MVDYVRKWTDKTEISQQQILKWIGIWSGRFCKWCRHYGKAFEHNGWIPRDHWLTESEKQAILRFHFEHPLDGYRRLTYMMLDADIVACSAGSVYRVLHQAGVLNRRSNRKSLKGTGFVQPLAAHDHWHVDVAYLNIRGTFYFIASVLDGFSRSVVHWEIREKMEERDIETILQRAREKHPGVTPRIISDNGPQFIAKDFKQFVRICGMTHVRTSPYYPQSNGKIERYHRTLKGDGIRPKTPLSIEDARRVVEEFVTEYNERRLHSALGYITPKDMLAGRQKEIHEERDRKLAEAREHRAQVRQKMRQQSVATGDKTCYVNDGRSEDRALLGSNPSAVSTPLAKGDVEVLGPPVTSALC